MKLRIQRLGKGWYKAYREDGGLWAIVYSIFTGVALAYLHSA